MATIEQYQSGEAAEAVKKAFYAMQNIEGSLPDTKLGEIFALKLSELEPLAISEKQAFEYIKDARNCAIGERLCNCEFPDAPSTCAVFLEELADAMVEAGKAAYASKEAACAAVSNHKGKPLVVSRVSGRYMEICRTWPEHCFYWNMEKRGMKCLKKMTG